MVNWAAWAASEEGRIREAARRAENFHRANWAREEGRLRVLAAGGLNPLERLVREFALQKPTAKREPQAPPLELGEAFIEWGKASNFAEGTFRSDASRPGDVTARFMTVLDGVFVEEGRKWEDFEITNPEDPEQKIICRRTVEVAFKSQKETTPQGEKRSGKFDQLRMSFSNGGSDQFPTYRNSMGQSFTPVVLSPLEVIREVSWAGRYVLITVMTKDMGHSLEAKLVLMNPPTGESSEGGSDYLSSVAGGSFNRDSNGGTEGDKTKQHDAEWGIEGVGRFTAATVSPASIGAKLPLNYEAGGFKCVDVGNGMNTGDQFLQGNPLSKPPITWVLDAEIGSVVTCNSNQEIVGEAVLVRRVERATAGGIANYKRYYNDSGGVLIEYQRKVYVFRPRHGAYTEKYYQPYAWVVLGIDISKLFKAYASHYNANQSPIRVGVHIVAGEPDEDGQPGAKMRWAVYRGRMGHEESVASVVGKGAFEGGKGYDPKTVDQDTIWDWALLPDSHAAEELVGEETVHMATGSIAGYDEPEEVFSWDYVHRHTQGTIPRFESGN